MAKARLSHEAGGDDEDVVPTKPTRALPGSPEKIEMLAARFAYGVTELFHDDDNLYHGPTDTDRDTELEVRALIDREQDNARADGQLSHKKRKMKKK